MAKAKVAPQIGAHVDPQDPITEAKARDTDLLQLFLIEKAAYELRYEIAHRPDWIEIPLRGLLEMVKP